MKKVRHVVFILFIISLIFSFSGCNKASTEKGNIGEIPPRVINCSLPSEYGCLTIRTYENISDYEAWIKEIGDGVILECEMVEDGTLIKSFEDNNEGEYGNYDSFVITPVKILKVHYQGENIEKEIKEGDIVNIRESYFWVTSDMEEVKDDYEVGTYLTVSEYYPMMLGKRYLIYGASGYLDDYGVKYDDPIIYGYQSVCLSEDSIHYERQFTKRSPIKYMEAWIKYSGKDTCDYSYSDIFTELEKSHPKVTQVDKSKIMTFDNLEDKTEFFESQKNAVIVYCDPISEGKQVTKAEENLYLTDYECFTMTSVGIEVLYAGEDVPNFQKGFKVKEPINVCEPYYQDDNQNLITHSKYYPMEESKSYILYAYVSEYGGETVLIPYGQAAAIPTRFDRILIPEHIQVLLGPEGVLQWFETWRKY